MKLKDILPLGFVKCHPLKEFEPEVVHYDLELKGFTFMSIPLNGEEWMNQTDHMEVDVCVTIYESDEQITFSDVWSLGMFTQLLKEQRTRVEVMGS